MYYSTPHSVTGKTPTELLLGRTIRTKIPFLKEVETNPITEEFQDRDWSSKYHSGHHENEKRNAKESNLKEADKVVMQNLNPVNKLSTTFDPTECTIVSKSGTRVTVQNEMTGENLSTQLSTRITEAATINIQSRTSDYHQQLQCAVLYKISDPIPHKFVDITDWRLHPSKQLADRGFNIPGNVDLLIGAGFFYKLLGNERVSLGEARPILQNTHLGWVVAGIYDTELSPATAATSSSALCFKSSFLSDESSTLNRMVARFWELEDFAPTKHLTEEERLCEEHYQQNTVRATSGRYIVKLPFRKDPALIGETAYSALHQFNAVSRKLERNPELRHRYFEYINEFIENGYISKADPAGPSERLIYLPHHGVLKEQSATTKLRVVFNASLKSTNGTSLNDLLMVGPVVQENLYTILLNFRIPCIAITGDIERMYLQIHVSEADKHRIRMLWQEPENPSLSTH
ncbi:uncharacterized protein LOC134202937 [Armigeres subalbatus]|uniref:uncharacterized protein LOC134202937 n=1 Tax=Armigeres subalbatus TaxID=124917 RepID=UPI002ED05CCA